MKYEYLPHYIDNYESVLDYDKYRELTKVKAGLVKRIRNEYEPMFNQKYIDLDRDDKLQERKKIIAEIKDYFKAKGGVGRASTPATLYENLLNGLIRGIPAIRYMGRKLNASDMIRDDFDTDEIKLVNGGMKQDRRKKAIDLDEIKRKWQNLLKKSEFTADTQATSVIKRNMRRLFERIKDSYSNRSESKESQRVSARMGIGFDVKSVFNAKSMKNFEKREDTYKYWENISVGKGNNSFEQLNNELLELSKLLDEIPKKDKEMQALYQFISDGENRKSLNYIHKFDRTEVATKDIDVVAYEAFESFLNYIGGIMEVQDVGLYENIDYSKYYNQEGEMQQSSDIDEKIEEDSLPAQIEEFSETLDEKQPLDPLGLIYFRNQLKGIGMVNTNLQELKEELKEYFDDLSDNNENYPTLKEEDVKATFENFLENLESVEDIGDELYLPIFMANDSALANEYRTLSGQAREIEDSINNFLMLFKEFIEKDKTTLSSQVNVDMTGLGTERASKDPEDRMVSRGSGKPFIWFSYGQYVAGSKGSQRYDSDKTDMKEAKDLDEKISVIVNLISKTMANCFLAPQFSPYRAGIRLPFEGDFTIRLISATRPIGEKYQAITAINKVLLERDTAFLQEEDIEDIIEYLQTLAGANNITNYSELYEKSRTLLFTLKNVFDDDVVTKNLSKDIGSILGSIYRLIPKDGKKEIDGKKENRFPKNKELVSDLYDARNANDPTDIYPIQALVDVIKTRGTNLEIRTEKGENETFSNEKAKRLLGLLDKVTKSVIQRKLLEAHDTLRILKSKSVIHSMKNENSYDDMENMITKMETDFSIDMSASEIIGVVKAVDSFEGIAKEYGIDAEHVYVLKANFR